MSEEARPRVVVANTASVDGKLAISPDRLLMGDPRWPASDVYGRVMAAGATALLEGAGSFVLDGEPRPEFPPAADSPDLRQDFLPDGVVARTRGWLAVADSRGRVRWQFKEFPDADWAGWHLLVLVARSTPADYLSFLRAERIPYLVRGDDRVDLAGALAALGTLGARLVAATCGGRLGGALLRAGLVDEIDLEVMPMAVGGVGVATLFDGPDLGAEDRPVALRLLSMDRDGDRVRLRYEVSEELEAV